MTTTTDIAGTERHELARVKVRTVSRKRPDGLQYEVLTAPPREGLKLIARMAAGGDAYAYAQSVRDRISGLAHVTQVQFIAEGF